MLLHADLRSKLERLLPFGWMLLGMGILYLFWLLAARDLAWMPAGKAPELFPWQTSTEPQILAFYSAPTVVRGEQGLICYGVVNVRALRLDPPVEQLKPALNRCFAVFPRQNTTYTLHAEGTDGKQLTASFNVAVVPPPPSFLFVDISAREITRGDRWAICYGVKNATSVRLEPPMGPPAIPAAKHCLMFFPPVSMEFKLTAVGEDGRTEVMKIPVKVAERKKPS